MDGQQPVDGRHLDTQQALQTALGIESEVPGQPCMDAARPLWFESTVSTQNQQTNTNDEQTLVALPAPETSVSTQIAAEASGYRFEMADETQWRAHLADEGFVVIKSSADAETTTLARSLLWDVLEQCTPAKRDDLASWGAWRLDKRGFSMHGTVTQGRGAWLLRSLPSVRADFAAIWGTADLIVSMDLLLVWKSWWRAPDGANSAQASRWTPKTEGLHVDQNPLTKPDFCCVQGMLPLYAVTHLTGGLEVVPRSHLPEAKRLLVAAIGEQALRGLGDFCRVPPAYYHNEQCTETSGNSSPTADAGAPMLVEAEPGDLILWDSRTVHGGRVGRGCVTNEGAAELARLSLPVCFTPRTLASADVLAARRAMFAEGKTTNHWPHAPRVQNQVSLGYAPIDLRPDEEALL